MFGQPFTWVLQGWQPALPLRIGTICTSGHAPAIQHDRRGHATTFPDHTHPGLYARVRLHGQARCPRTPCWRISCAVSLDWSRQCRAPGNDQAHHCAFSRGAD
jgi:hypothetical protein